MSYGAFKPDKKADNPLDMLAELEVPKSKSSFVPGRQGKPRSGVSASEFLNNREHLLKMASLIREHEQTHGGKLKGPAVREMMIETLGTEVSAPQARTVLRRINNLLKKSIKA